MPKIISDISWFLFSSLAKARNRSVVLQIGDKVCAFISSPERMAMALVYKESKDCFLMEDETLIRVANVKGQKSCCILHIRRIWKV